MGLRARWHRVLSYLYGAHGADTSPKEHIVNEATSPVQNLRGTTPIIPAGMEWDAAEYADKDGLEAADNGTVFFADSRNDAWHQLGQQFGRAMDAEELMRESHLGGWNVRKAPLTTITEDGAFDVEGHYAVIRTNPITGIAEPLPGAVVGNVYTPVQNEQNCDVLAAIVDASGAVFETAGSLNRGRNTFVTMKLPDTMKIGGQDALDLNIAALNSHDGTSSFTLLVTPVRIVCQNTQAAAIAEHRSRFNIRHTATATQRIAAARQALDLTFEYLEAFQAEAEAMMAKSMSDAEFVALTDQLWKPVDPDAKTTRSATIAANRTRQLDWLFNEAPTQAAIRGTAWAGYQAVVEYADHYSQIQGRGDDKDDARAKRVILGAFDELKTGAFARVREFASV